MTGISTARALEPQLRAWLRRVTPSGLEIDDLIQEAYARLAGLPPDFTITYPKAYLYQITKRLISDHIRHSAVVSIEALVETAQLSVLDTGFTPERILSGREELERLYQAIARLPAPFRKVFIMRKFDAMPQKAIATELRISEHTVEKRMSRALRMLLEHLQVGEQPAETHMSLVPSKRRGARSA
jgi:RNA polymerase sigma factor (sigma-70 family)